MCVQSCMNYYVWGVFRLCVFGGGEGLPPTPTCFFSGDLVSGGLSDGLKVTWVVTNRDG